MKTSCRFIGGFLTNTRKSVATVDPTILSELAQLDVDIAQLESRRTEIISEIPYETGSRPPNIFSGRRRKQGGESSEIPVAMLVLPNQM